MPQWIGLRDRIKGRLGSRCKLLLHAEAATVAQWLDSSGQGNHLPGVGTNDVQSGGFGPRGRAHVNFDGTGNNYYHLTTGFAGIPAGTAAIASLCVYTIDDAGDRNTVVDIRASGANDYVFRLRSNQTTPILIPRIHAAGDASSTELVGTVNLPTGANLCFVESWTTPTGGDGLFHCRLNGGTDDTAAVADSGGLVTTNFAAARAMVGHTLPLTNGWMMDGKIALVSLWSDDDAATRAEIVRLVRHYYNDSWQGRPAMWAA